MRAIEIDEEVYSYLQAQAVPFEDTPNLILRRLLMLDQLSSKPAARPPAEAASSGRRRKADLATLVSCGLLRDGELLNLHDYRGNPVPGAAATVRGGALEHDGARHSMSQLARALLESRGYSSKAVRGPLFWRTESGKSIKDLWDQHLDGPDHTPSSGPEQPNPDSPKNRKERAMTWRDWIVTALQNLGGQAQYQYLYNEILRVRPEPFPRTWQAIVRRTIEMHSSDSDNYRPEHADLFYSVSGIGSGEWGLR